MPLAGSQNSLPPTRAEATRLIPISKGMSARFTFLRDLIEDEGAIGAADRNRRAGRGSVGREDGPDNHLGRATVAPRQSSGSDRLMRQADESRSAGGSLPTQ